MFVECFGQVFIFVPHLFKKIIVKKNTLRNGDFLIIVFTQAIRLIQNVNGTTPDRIDVSGFSSGQYILRVESKGIKDAVRAVIVQK